MEELKAKFEALPEHEKMEFMKMIMPSMCNMFKQNPQQIMQDMMPFCSEIMKDCNMDMSKMMSIMMK